MIELSRRRALQSGAALTALAPVVSACAAQPGEVAAASAAMAFQDGIALAGAIARGETTALEVAEASIARAEAVEPQINAIANETYDLARAEAAAPADGPFSGVPSFTKDLIDRRGEPTLLGSRGFEGYVAQADAPFAAAWRQAGILSLGKSTTPEMGLISSTEPLVTGATRNPWDLSRIPGGSSGGAAALVAARVVPFAHASDGGGSIRIPAACCGLFGLKPSRARLFGRGGPAPAVDISVDHAVTLTVRDSAALFAIAEVDDGTYPRLGVVTGPSRERLRIGFAPDPIAGTPLDPEVRAAAEATAQLCRDLGHEVIDDVLPIDGPKFTDQFLMYWAAGAAEFAARTAAFSGKPVGPEIVEPWTLGLMTMFLARQDEFEDIVAYLQGFQAQYESMFEDIDVLLTPTVSRPAPPIGEQDPAGDFEAVMDSVVSFAAYTAPMNVAGAASMSVPLAWSETGLPIGMMFSGRQGDDGRLFELAYELEAARPWIDRLPPLTA